MRSKKEIQDRIDKLIPQLEKAEESYFTTIQEKQEGGEIYTSDFVKIESEYELLKKEVETLEWILEPGAPVVVVQELEIIKETSNE